MSNSEESNSSSENYTESGDATDIICIVDKTVIWKAVFGPTGAVSRVLSDYREHEVLGRGGYGCVVKVQSKLDEQTYALKKVDLFHGYSRARKEVIAMATLSHRNIARYYTSWVEGETAGLSGDNSDEESSSDSAGYPMLCILMEWCEGSTLRAVLDDAMTDEEKHLRTEEVWTLFEQLVQTLDYILSKNIRHGDLTPRNIFLDGTRKMVKVIDFGLSSLVAEGELEVGEEPPPTSYCPPEVKHKRHFYNNSDVYSLGLILLEMVGHFTTHQERSKAITDLTENDILPPNVQATTSTADLIRSMTQIDPDERTTVSEILVIRPWAHG